jgi:signal transduction histidine kinase
MEAITGYRASTTIGTYRLGTLRPRDANGNDILLERWLDQDALPSVVRILTATGETRWLSCSWTRIGAGGAGTDADAEVACILVARDVTEGHKLERIKQEFVATVSHELRTPLAPILGWATTLLTRGDRLPEKDRRNGLEAILRQGQRLERLIVNLLEVSKIEAGAGSDGNREIHVATIARGVIDELRAAWPQRVIELELPDHPCMAIGNDVWVEQIITNLVSNAIKYAPPPAPIVLRLRALAGELEVSVVDQGPGIPLEEQQHIFGRFERYAHADTQPGTGLGLYISRQLADAMGADLHVTSRVGEGATFSLCLRAPVQLVAVS